MICRTHKLSVTRQARLLKLSRSSVYYSTRGASHRVLRLMGKIDKLHLKHPFAGARML